MGSNLQHSIFKYEGDLQILKCLDGPHSLQQVRRNDDRWSRERVDTRLSASRARRGRRPEILLCPPEWMVATYRILMNRIVSLLPAATETRQRNLQSNNFFDFLRKLC